jgi:hypothetical protein
MVEQNQNIDRLTGERDQELTGRRAFDDTDLRHRARRPLGAR